MASEITPVFRSLFELADNTGNSTYDRPITVQITKWKPTVNGFIMRISDGEFTVACMLAQDIDTSFADRGRIVQIVNYEVGCAEAKAAEPDSPKRVFFSITHWKDVGPSSTLVGEPVQMNSTHVNGAGYLISKPATETSRTTSNSTPQQTKTSSGSRRNDAKQISIESLSPYVTNWDVLARVTKKTDIREFVSKANNNKGKLFNVIFTDETGDIAATGFTDAVDKHYHAIVEGQQYNISNLSVRNANKKFNQTGHDYELYFTNETKLVPAQTDRQLPSVFFNFVPSIAALSDHKVDSTVDVVGVCSRIDDLQTVTSKTSNIPYDKRDIELLDDSGSTIQLTLWGDQAQKFSYPIGTVVGVKGARLSDFKGLTLSATRSAVIYTDPDDKHAHKIKGWYQATGGKGMDFTPVSSKNGAQDNAGSQGRKTERLTIDQVFTNGIGRSETPDFFRLKARISSIGQRTVAYPACTNGDCRKKVVESSDGQWRCEKCQVSIPEPQWRYILNITLADPTSEDLGIQTSVFDDVGRVLYGDRAGEFQRMRDSSGGDFNRELHQALKVIQGDEFIWSIKASSETYNGAERVRYTVLSTSEPDPITEGLQLLSEMGF